MSGSLFGAGEDTFLVFFKLTSCNKEMIGLRDFFVYYPEIGDAQFEEKLSAKHEFGQLALADKLYHVEAGEYFPYQHTVARFISAQTPYNGLLVVHAMGTGKTCTAVLAIETSKSAFRGAIILAPNEKLLDNFQNELVFKCTQGTYIPDNYEKLTPGERVRRTNIKTAYYKFETLEKFARQLAKMSNADIVNQFDKHIWVFDEAHEITSTKFSTQYPQFLRALHLCKNSKILLLTGTPMLDNVAEIAPLLNLILPEHLQLDTTPSDFAAQYLTSTGRANYRLEQAMRGRVSYLRASTHELAKHYNGRLMKSLKYLPVVVDIMSPFQRRQYLKVYEEERQSQNFFVATRAAELALFPDGSSSVEDANKFYTVGVGSKFSLTSMARAYFDSRSKLDQVSSRYSALLDSLDEAYLIGHNTFVYSSSVQGIGVYYLVALMQHYGWTRATGNERSRGKRFVFLDPALPKSELKALMRNFNVPANKHGDFFSVIIGTDAVATGFSFLRIQQVEVLTPHWNFKKVLQAIARGTRVGSQAGLTSPTYEVNLRVTLPSEEEADKSISLYMYETAERKDILINHIERDLEINSFDCAANYAQNHVTNQDNKPECQYLPCEYRCRGETQPIIDYSSYNLLYATDLISATAQKIVSYFENTSVYCSFDTLATHIQPLTNFVLLSALEYLIESNIIIRAKYVLREHENIYYLSSLDKQNTRYYDTWFFTNTFVYTNWAKSAQIIESASTEKIVDSMLRQDEVTTRRYFYQLDRAMQTTVFEEMTSINNSRPLQNSWLYRVATHYFDNFVETTPTQLVHWINAPIIKSLQRGVGDTQWQIANEDTTRHYNTLLNRRQTALESNPYKYYGQYSKLTDSFCIRNVNVISTKRHQRTSGKRCGNWDRGELLDLATNTFKIAIPVTSSIDAEPLDELRRRAAELQWFISTPDTPRDTLERALYFNSKPTNELCTAIFLWFQSKGLLIEDPDCGQQGKPKPLTGSGI